MSTANTSAFDLATMDATAQAELVRTGQISPLELVDAAIRRIEKINPQLNAVVWERFETARAEARSSDLPKGPFTGVPFLTKDLGCTMAGRAGFPRLAVSEKGRVCFGRDHGTGAAH